MRLTLRTLLAYLDGTLEQQDAKTLGERIQESPAALQLIDRIKTGLATVGSPADGNTKPLRLDPNAIAEYLDNSLAIELIPDFERLCLDHSSALTEVADCHRLLSTALKSTIEIDDGLRRRLHQMLKHAPQGSLSGKNPGEKHPIHHVFSSSSSGTPGKTHDSDSNVQGDRDEADTLSGVSLDATSSSSTGEFDLSAASGRSGIPQYLREDRKVDWKSPLWNGILIALMFILLWQAVGSWDRIRVLWSMPNPAVTQTDIGWSKDETPIGMRTPISGRRDSSQSVPAPETLSKQPAPINQGQPETLPTETAAGNAVPVENASQGEENRSVRGNSDVPAKENAESTESSTDMATTVSEDKKPEEVTQPVVKPLTIDAVPPKTPGVLIAGTWLPQDTDPSKSIVFAWETPAEGQMPNVHLLTPGIGLKLRTHVLVPAVNRTHFSLVPGGRIEAVGPSEIELLQALPTHSMRLYRGRFVLSSDSNGRSFDVHLADRVIHLEWDDQPGSCVVQVEPIIDPEATERSRANAYIQPIRVPLKWTVRSSTDHPEEVSTSLQVLETGAYLAITPWHSPMVVPIDNLPSWINGSEERPIDIAGASELALSLQQDVAGSCTAKLRALLGHRRSELAALALRNLISLGEFDSIFGENGALSKDSMRAHWENIVSDIKATLAAHPEYWPRLRQATEAVHGERGRLIESLIVGPTQQQLQEGGDRSLVDLLRMDQPLEIRILAFHVLKARAGQDLGYIPERPTPLTVEAWQQLVNQGGLRPK